MQSDLLDPVARFKGPEGERRLFDVLCQQEIILNDKALAQEFQKIIDLKSFEAGDEIITQDDINFDLWLILTGSVTIWVNRRQVATRERGTHVGEMALLDVAARRCASVRADEQLVAGRIGDANFEEIANMYPIVWKRIAGKLVSRLQQSNSRLQPPNDLPHIFIGSSKEDETVAKEFYEELSRDHKLKVEMWTSSEAFPTGLTTIENLENLIHSHSQESSDFAL